VRGHVPVHLGLPGGVPAPQEAREGEEARPQGRPRTHTHTHTHTHM
jgi:hypothetical protein